ncbi:hypothetical protein [Streptomyces sp. NPDC048720]|uniref:hypothetical protein n=1 Tax=Streptomyces sp. NPDC048720 TaxID=3365588 RepID=UPI00371FF011
MRADYLRLLALACPRPAPSRSWAPQTQDARRRASVTAACDVVSASSAVYGALKPMRLTPERVAQFLEEVRASGMTISRPLSASFDAAIHQRWTRDREFAKAMDAARAEAKPTM